MKKRTATRMLALAAALCLLCACGGADTSGATATVPPPAARSGGDTSPPAAQPVRMGLVMPQGDYEFVARSVLHARAELESLVASGNFEYTLLTAAEPAQQAAAVETALAERPDVVVLWPVEGDALRAAAHAVLDTGAALILYDRLIDDFYPTAAITGDNYTIGLWTGEYLLKAFAPRLAEGGEMGYLRFVGSTATGISAQRSAGLDDAFAASEYAEQLVQLAPDFETQWTAGQAGLLMAEYLDEAPSAELEHLHFIVAHDDEMVDGITDALAAWEEDNPGRTLPLQIICGVGGRRETLERYDNGGPFGARLLTYYFSPSFIRQAVRLGLAAATGAQYDGADITGQTFLIPTIEIGDTMVGAYRLSREYAERYSI